MSLSKQLLASYHACTATMAKTAGTLLQSLSQGMLEDAPMAPKVLLR